MKRVISAICVLSFLFGCSRREPFGEAERAAENTAAQTAYTAAFIAEISVEKENLSVMFSHGEFSIDREKMLYSMTCNQVYLGTASAVGEYYGDGFLYADAEGEKIKYEAEGEKLFSYFYLSPPLIFSENDIADLKKRTNAENTVYTFNVKKNYHDKLLALMGDNIYDIASSLAKPQKEKTTFSGVYCEYVISNGSETLGSYTLGFNITVYDTPRYKPGYTPKESDYTLTLAVKLKLTYKQFGDIKIEAPDISQYESVQ